jgi:hypothetical protein
MNIDQLINLVSLNFGTLVFLILGALLLTGLSIKEHVDRDPKDKMSKTKYSLYFVGWLFGYPIMGFVVAAAYLSNDNQFGAWLSLQIGLTSPAIIAGLASGGANILAKDGVPTSEDQ